jgi:hypothetical protein
MTKLAMRRTALCALVLALLRLGPAAAASARNKPQRSAEERLDAVESLARHALARLDDLEERVTKTEQHTTAMKDEIAAVKAVVVAHVDILAEHSRLLTNHSEELRAAPEQPEDDNPATGASRRLQAAPNSTGKVVHIHKATASIPAGPGWGMSPNYNGGHRRRSLQNAAQCRNMATRAQQVQARCCDEPTEDCSGGYPRTCNAGCAAVFLPFWTECGSLLGNAAVYQQTVALCRQAQPATPASSGSLAHEFNLVCADGAVDSCVPACSEALRGDLLLMNLNGEDSKYSCELHHGLHSWVGAATDGGYLGSDVRAFVSAVLSGAAGYYALALTGDARIDMDLTIRLGQDVQISGGGGRSAVPWGSGGFTVQQGGSLSMVGVVLVGGLTVVQGGNATVSGGSLALYSGSVAVSPSTTLTLDSQCGQPYTTVGDSWRAVANTVDNHHGDCANGGTGVGGDEWFRFIGTGGDALALMPPGRDHCGTVYGGWLSGWDGGGDPPGDYNQAGHFPVAAEGVVDMKACFDQGGAPFQCNVHATVGVVRCGAFLLWRLPWVRNDSCDAAFCTAPSGL